MLTSQNSEPSGSLKETGVGGLRDFQKNTSPEKQLVSGPQTTFRLVTVRRVNFCD